MNGGERGRPVLAVVTSTGAALRFFDGLTYDPPGDLPVLAQPHETAVDAGAGVPYVSHTYRSGVHTGPGREGPRDLRRRPSRAQGRGGGVAGTGGAPRGLALNRDRGPLYATVLSAGGLAPLVTAPVGRGPITIRTTPDGDRAFVADLGSGTVHVVDLADGSVGTVLDIDPGDPDTTQGAHGIAYLP
ncbi:YncE family protein [Streptomyces sp. NPDC092046]|uniref:YncE family protein n=1 Tax=Streptomyces sp. NPDC092046 TaxID=3366009 RepID=UPI003825372E